jgi:hypothetical protein
MFLIGVVPITVAINSEEKMNVENPKIIEVEVGEMRIPSSHVITPKDCNITISEGDAVSFYAKWSKSIIGTGWFFLTVYNPDGIKLGEESVRPKYFGSKSGKLSVIIPGNLIQPGIYRCHLANKASVDNSVGRTLAKGDSFICIDIE